nr:hypothetical protein [Calditrichia bacterium]
MTFRNAPYLLVVLALLVMAGFIYSQQQKGSGMQGNNKETFSREWEQVMQFQDQGLPQSALEVVEKIYREARKSGNRVQVVKAIGYRVSLKASFEEEPFFNLVNTLKAEIGESRFPEKAILQSMLAEAYYVYYQSQRYQILDRSSLINGPGEDARTWDPGTFFDRIRETYLASLERPAELQQFPLADFEPLLNVNTTARTL